MMTLAALGLVQPFLLTALIGQDKARPPRSFSSKTITSRTPGHAVDITVDITGAKKLYLIVTDGGNDFSCDWADWAEPRLSGPKGEKKLTELKWRSAQADWGQVHIGKNAAGGPLRIAGKDVAYGIGTHANSIIAFDLPEGYTRFQARGGLDDGGTQQNNGQATSVQFHVLLDKLPREFVKKSSGNYRGGLEPAEALAQLDVGEGLEATLFAAEPLLLSPSDIDVDARGRVWVCEVVNYRGRNGTRKEGDRILILEDTNGDGKADKQKVYYQGRDIDSAMGICVLGNKVIVSCSPNVWVFTDDDGDDVPDRKELLFTKTGQPQHDHSAHAFQFGPDGRLYWNFGNTGNAVHDKDGKPVVSKAGYTVANNGRPYRQGMAFRCDTDGKNFEVLGWNFRNNYEVTVDSFGTCWQSDNDDDGNRGVRINYVMEFGNYGYVDEITGAGWQTPRTNMEKEIPLRHWHQNDPGVVPNLLLTGAGSPTGICVYEGKLLPKELWGQLIHCDAGPNIVRAYPAERDGAGYKAKMLDILSGTRDRWFRPSDVCVAPDGSLIIADWYDPGVGGHGMGDIDRGRIFRIAPPKTAYKIPQYDYATPEGAVQALQNPALSVRYLAWTALNSMGKKAEPALSKLYQGSDDPRLRARALWLLARIPGQEERWISTALTDDNADIRIVGLRLARELERDVLGCVEKLARDPSPQVRRECALALAYRTDAKVPVLWSSLAEQHDGKDRWYLEALGIAARNHWDNCLSVWLKSVGPKWNTAAGRDILWRSRGQQTPAYLAKIIADPNVAGEDLPRYFRAFDFQSGKEKEAALVELAFTEAKGDAQRKSLISTEALKRLNNFDVNRNPQHRAALERVLDSNKGTKQFIELVAKFRFEDRYPQVLDLAQKNPDSQLGVDAIGALLSAGQLKLISERIASKDVQAATATVQALGTAADGRAIGLLRALVHDSKQPLPVRREAVRGLARIREGAQELVTLASAGKLDNLLKEAAGAALHQSQWQDVKDRAQQLFPLPQAKDNRPLPTIAELLRRQGSAERGQVVFQKQGTCANCHVVRGTGKNVGPDLSEIGDKLSRQALFEAILFPSAAISHNYERFVVVLANGNTAEGLLVSQTPDMVTIRGADALERTFRRSEIDEIAKQPISLMPADLVKLMSEQDIVDVVSYLTTLHKVQAPMKTSRDSHRLPPQPQGQAPGAAVSAVPGQQPANPTLTTRRR